MRQAAAGRALGRRGFTLVELLVVISIIAVLMALSAAATLRFLGVQQTSNTRTTLVKVQGQVDKQWAAVTDQANKEPIPPAVKSYILANLAGTDANAERRARVIYVKLKQKQMFPMSYGEAINPVIPPMPPVGTYVAHLKARGITAATPGGPQAHESAVCLLMALERNPAGGGIRAEDLGVSNVLEFPGGGSQTVRGIVDAWKSPVVFSRWPTDTTELNPGAAPQNGFNDAVDPEGLLSASSWTSSGHAATFQSLLHKVAPAGKSYRLAPLVMSAGPDKKAGVNLATLAPGGADANDNVFSSRQP